MNDKLNITIKIADIEPIHFEIERQEEEIYRKAEYHINRLWESWHKSQPRRSADQLMARIALAFAELYYRKIDQLEQSEKMLADFESSLDDILLSAGSLPLPPELPKN